MSYYFNGPSSRGNCIIMAGSTLAIIGLTWGGVRYPWKSAQVLVPLLVGIALILSFVICEAFVPKLPTIPFKVLTNRTTIGGYVTSHLSQTLIAKSGLYQIHRNPDTRDYKYFNHMCVSSYPVHNRYSVSFTKTICQSTFKPALTRVLFDQVCKLSQQLSLSPHLHS